jgi:hypothetical protein
VIVRNVDPNIVDDVLIKMPIELVYFILFFHSSFDDGQGPSMHVVAKQVKSRQLPAESQPATSSSPKSYAVSPFSCWLA